MRFTLAAGIIGLITIGGVLAADPPDPLAARKEAWQKALEKEKFRFPESTAGVLFSLSQYNGDCKVHMIYDPKLHRGLTFKFERGGKDVVTIAAHTESVFRSDGKRLYFAKFGTSGNGCSVVAYDLTSGKNLWETMLRGVGPIDHSVYRNKVTMEISSFTEVGKESEGAITIIGRESYGDYIEVLDRATGTTLAHKVYRKGFAKPK